MTTTWIRHLSSLFCFFFLVCAHAQNKVSDISFSADSSIRDIEKKELILEGNVQAIFNNYHLAADKVIIKEQSKEVSASGNVILQSISTYAEASRLVFNYQTNLGTLYDGFLQSGQVVFEGKIIEKVGEKEYVATEGEFTSCTNCPASWSFYGDRIEAELGGYASIDNSFLKIAGIRSFFLPWILVPLKSSRQSGLLVPHFNYSQSGGFAIAQSYFWAISQSRDMTLTAQKYAHRGWKGRTEYRYVLTPQSHGHFDAAYIRDEAFKDINDTHQKTLNRGFVNYSHFFHLPDNLVHRMQIHHVSDLRYPRDFPEEIQGHGEPALENRQSITKNANDYHFSAETAYYINLLKTESRTDNVDAVHRMPEIRWSLVDREIYDTGVFFRLDTNYTNFVRPNFGYDEVTSTNGVNYISRRQDGKFDATSNGADPNADLIRSGQRADIIPSLTYPFKIADTIDVLPKISYRETQYRFSPRSNDPTVDYSPSAARRYIQTDLSARTLIGRVYGRDDNDPQATLFKHEIEPEIGFSSIPSVRRPNHVFFGRFEDQPFSRNDDPITDNDVFSEENKLQFDYNDRVFDKRVVRLGVTNRLIRKRTGQSSSEYKDITTFKLWQNYDFNEANRDRPRPWSTVNALLKVNLDRFETHTTLAYYPYARTSNMSSRIKVRTDSGDFFEVSYSRILVINENQDFSFNNRTENIGTRAGFHSRYIDFVGQINYSAVTYKVVSWGYQADIKPPGDCWSLNIRHDQVIASGDQVFRINFDFKFGGVQPQG